MNLRYAALGAALLCAQALYGQNGQPKTKEKDNKDASISDTTILLDGNIKRKNEDAYEKQKEKKLGEIEYLIYDAQNKLFRGTSYYKGAYYLDTRRTLRFIVRDYNSLRYVPSLTIDTLRLYPITNTIFTSFLNQLNDLSFIPFTSGGGPKSVPEEKINCININIIGEKIDSLQLDIKSKITEYREIQKLSQELADLHAVTAQEIVSPSDAESRADALLFEYNQNKNLKLDLLPSYYLSNEFEKISKKLKDVYKDADTLIKKTEEQLKKVDHSTCAKQISQINAIIKQIKESKENFEKSQTNNQNTIFNQQKLLLELKLGIVNTYRVFPPIVSDNQDGMQLTLLMHDRYPAQVGDKKLNAIEAIDIPIIYYNQFKLDFSTGIFVGRLGNSFRDQRFELMATGDTARVRYLSNGISRDTTVAQLGVSKVQESNLVIGPMAFLHAYHKWRNVSVGVHLGLGARLNQVDRLRPIYAIGASVMFGRYQRAIFNLSYFWTPVTRLADNEKEGVIYDLLDNGARPLLRTPTPTQVNTQQIMGSGVGFSFSWNLTAQTKFKRYKPEPETPPRPNASGSDAEGSKPPKFKTTGKKVKTQNNTETVEDQVPDK